MSEIFDTSFFNRLNQLKLSMHIRLDQGQTGGRKSSAKGSSVEFSDFREYLPGDDIRRIDWNVYGRLDKLVVKQFMEEKEAFYHVFIDTSASMNFGTPLKSTLALQLAAVFVYLVQKQLDRVEVLTSSDGRLDRLSPITGRSSFGRLLKELEEVKFQGTTRLSSALLRTKLPGRGVCILLSDFLDPEGVEASLKYLAYKKQQVLLLQILSPEELSPTIEGTAAITDLETGQEVRVTMGRAAEDAYTTCLNQHLLQLESLAKKYGFSYLRVSSNQDLNQIVFESLQKKGIFG